MQPSAREQPSRRRFLKGAVALGSLGLSGALAACAGGAPAPAAGSAAPAAAKPAGAAASAAAAPAAASATPRALTTVRYGLVAPPAVANAGVLIAEARGWFADEGIQVEQVPFESAARMVAPLSTNQLEAGSGGMSAGVFNGYNRGVELVIVADLGSTSPGNGFQGVVVRKDLVDDGRFRSTADLRGLKLGVTTLANVGEVSCSYLLAQAGMVLADVELVTMSFPDMIIALANGSLDAAYLNEPFITDAIERGVAVVHKRVDEFHSNAQAGVLLYSPAFAQNTDPATRFMVAYLKGVRRFNDAFGKRDAQARAEVIDILAESTALKSKALYDKVVMPGLHPNGTINVADLRNQERYYIEAGEQQEAVDMGRLVNSAFVEAAVARLGPYN